MYVRTPKEKKSITTREKAMVVDLKASVATAFSVPIDQFILTYAGKIMKDRETLDGLGISAGEMVHLVKTSVIMKLSSLKSCELGCVSPQ